MQEVAEEKAREEGKPTTPPEVKPDEKPKADEDAKPKEESKPEEKDETEKPSKSDCNTTIKILEQYERLAKKLGLKLPPKRLQDLNNKRQLGTITIDDLPAKLKGKFPAKLNGMTLSEILTLCSKSK